MRKFFSLHGWMIMKVIYFGTPDIAAHVLHFLLEHHVNVVAVVTKPDRPKGRSGDPVPTPVKLVAQAHSLALPVYQPELVSAIEFAPTLEQYQADLFVVVAYGEIMKQHLLDMPKIACINLHASLLPKYRGAAPIQRCIVNGEKESGVTIMHMVKKMDAGDMIKTVKVSIGPNTTAGELTDELDRVGSQALLDVIHEFSRGAVPTIPQDPTQATMAPKIELEDGEVKWAAPAQQIHNLVRGVTPHPGGWCFVTLREQKKRMKLLITRVVPEMAGEPGHVLSADKHRLIIACGEQALEIVQLQLEGKKMMAADEFLRGFVGTVAFC